jgi:hypothetical protein
MTVTDTQSGAVNTYTNQQSTAFQTIQDTAVFVCPRATLGRTADRLPTPASASCGRT